MLKSVVSGVVKTCTICLSAYACLSIINMLMERNKSTVIIVSRQQDELNRARQAIVDKLEAEHKVDKTDDSSEK